MWQQREVTLPASHRGFHLITDYIERALDELAPVSVGLLHLQLLHTSASLTINENADPSVRRDMEQHFSVIVPENQPYYEHIYEGSDVSSKLKPLNKSLSAATRLQKWLSDLALATKVCMIGLSDTASLKRAKKWKIQLSQRSSGSKLNLNG